MTAIEADGNVMLLGLVRRFGRDAAHRSALADWIVERLPAAGESLHLRAKTRTRTTEIIVRRVLWFGDAEMIEVDLHNWPPGYHRCFLLRVPVDSPTLAASVAAKMADVFRK